jgi:demethylmenaquinone methyltransferase/2-methoxy-6-polyprenyl-1,4-benzoquinol methylase
MFNDIAASYDRLNRWLSLGVDRAWRRDLIRRVAEHQPASVLDVATGTADVALALKQALPEAAVHGVDFAEDMLAVGRAKAQRRDVDITLTVGDGMNLNQPDASVDALTIAFGLRNFEDPERGLAEFHRVIKPGGHLYVLEFPPPEGLLQRLFFRLYFTTVVPLLGRWISGHASAYTYLPESTRHFPSPSRLGEAMQRQGFSEVSWRLYTFGVAALHTARKPSEAESNHGAAPA